MRNLKKFLALVLAMIMVVSAAAVVSADFTDVTADNRYADAINDLAVKGIVRGTTETTFGPAQDVQRYQMALFTARALTANLDDADWQTGIVPFTDVTSYVGAIEYNYVNGIINGIGNNLFAPDAGIKYVEALKMAVCALGYTAEGADWTWAYYNKAAALGLTANMDITSLDDVLNRAETAQIIYNMLYAVPADGGLSLAERNFDIQTAANTTTFVITATPKQYYAYDNDGTDYNSASDVEGEYVGIQKLVSGLPSGNILYYTCEQLGIPAEDVEDYFNRAVELVNFDEATKTFSSAVLGDAPKSVTHADVTEYAATSANAGKLTVDGTLYTVDDAITGATLINEMVLYVSNTANAVEQALMLVVDGDGYVISSTTGAPVGQIAYESANGTRYFYDYANSVIISEKDALELWGIPVIDEAAKFAKVTTLEATALYDDAYILDLYDDDRDGLYERAVYTPIFMGVYYTELGVLNDKEVELDKLVGNLGYDEAVDAVAYTNEAAQEDGAISVYTYNDQLKVVDVIEVLEVKTGDLTKVNARGFADGATNESNVVKVTLGGEVYTLAYDIDAQTANTAKWSVQGAQLGATAITTGGEWLAIDVTELEEDPALVIADDKEDLDDFIETAELGATYAFVEYNGYVLMLSEVIEEEAYSFTVIKDFFDFDIGEIYLDLYLGGKLEEEVVVTEIAGYELAKLRNHKFTQVLSEVELFYPGLIYTYETAEDGSAILDVEITADNFFEYDLINAKFAANAYATDAGVDYTDFADILAANELADAVDYDSDDDGIADVTYTIDFDNGKSGTERANMLRTDDETIFYFVRSKTWDDLTKAEKSRFGNNEATWTAKGHPEADERIVSVYVGEADDVSITFGEATQIYTDKLGRGADDLNGVANVVFVIDYEDHTFFTPDDKTSWVLMKLTTKNTTEVVYADELDLDTEYYEDKYYVYSGDFVNLDTGAKIGEVYTSEKLDRINAYVLVEVDENNVLVDAGSFNLWNDDTVVSLVEGVRYWDMYGIEDLNGNATKSTDSAWETPDTIIDYYDWLYYHKTNLDVAGKVKVPTSILNVELESAIIEIEDEDGYYVIEDLTVPADICEEGDKIDTIKVVDLSNLASVKTGDEALKYLENAPVIAYIADAEYFMDGCIVFVTGTQIAGY